MLDIQAYPANSHSLNCTEPLYSPNEQSSYQAKSQTCADLRRTVSAEAMLDIQAYPANSQMLLGKLEESRANCERSSRKHFKAALVYFRSKEI